MKEKSKTRRLVERLIYNALTILKEAGGTMRSADVEDEIGKRLQFDEWESANVPSGNPRWQNNLYYYSINLTKSGFIVSNKGRWTITDDGIAALEKYTPEQLYQAAEEGYKKWWKAREAAKSIGEPEPPQIVGGNAEPDGNAVAPIDVKAKADEEIRDYIMSVSPFDFQDMVAALLRAMGYYTPFIAPKGRDGGVDIIAYSDPLGATQPILKVQVKRYSMDNPVTVDVVRSIMGVSKNDVPVVVTSGRFAEQARTEARINNVRLIDGFEFIDLWIAYYDKMTEEDKARMPIEPVYFIKRTEQ